MTSAGLSEPRLVSLTNQWVVVDKPPGWLTIPGRLGKSFGVLSDWVREHYSPIWVVHRLDVETSGVVLFSRTSQDHASANTWFEQRKMKKVYHCLAAGVPFAPVFKIAEPVGGSPATTQVEVMEKYREGFLARILPQSGRRHQIRIHLSTQGFPLWGDRLYRGPEEISFSSGMLPVRRVALHASSLQLPTGEVFKAEFPGDFNSWLERLRKDGNRV